MTIFNESCRETNRSEIVLRLLLPARFLPAESVEPIMRASHHHSALLATAQYQGKRRENPSGSNVNATTHFDDPCPDTGEFFYIKKSTS